MNAGIVGAGIMGRLLALSLLNEGWQVTLFDEAPRYSLPLNCSSAAAGLLTPVSELDKTDRVIYRLGTEALDSHWDRILKQLAEPIYFQRAGSLVINHPHDNAEWHNFSQRINRKLDKSNTYQQLSQQALLLLEPELPSFETAYYFPNEAQIDSQALLQVLETYLCNHGVTWMDKTHVSSIQPRKVITNRDIRQFDMVFDCRGLGAKSIFPDLRGLRGELIWLHAPQVNLNRPIRFLHPRYNLYIVPRPNKHYLIGASEIEAEEYSTISVRTTLELLTAIYSVHAGFAEARILKTVTQCRPTLSHHLPRIKLTNGLIAVNGLYRHGFLIAPSLAQEIVKGLKINNRDIYYPEIWEDFYENNTLQ